MIRRPNRLVQTHAESYVATALQHCQQALNLPETQVVVIRIFVLNPTEGRTCMFQASQLFLVGWVEAAVDHKRVRTRKVRMAVGGLCG